MEWIDITGCNLIELVKLTYDMSVPVLKNTGQFTKEPLTKDEAKELINYECKNNEQVIAMDYVKGRCCKMDVFLKRGKISMPNPWYRHTDGQLQELFNKLGIKYKVISQQHGMTCHCKDCENEDKL